MGWLGDWKRVFLESNALKIRMTLIQTLPSVNPALVG